MPTEGGDLRIELLDPAQHHLAGFSCGVKRLDNYLKPSAKKQQKDDMTRVYVAVKDDGAQILGYHAINVGMMNVHELFKYPRGAPEHGEIPVLFLGQVAVGKTAQGRGIGSILMHHIFCKACKIADNAGCHAIVLVLCIIHLIPFPGASGGPASRTPRDPPGCGSTGTGARLWRCGARCSPQSPRYRRPASQRPRS